MQRLQNSLDTIFIKADISGLLAPSEELIAKNGVTDGYLRVMFTRGGGGFGYLPSQTQEPSVIIEAQSFAAKNDGSPVDLWVSTYRKIPPACLPAQAKHMQGMNSTLARMQAAENKCFEALLLSVEGVICECSSSNIFWVRENILHTPSLSCGILSGTIRSTIIEKSPLRVAEGEYKIEDIAAADEVFITNVMWLAKPVKSLWPVGAAYGSFSVAEQINRLLAEDIGRYCAK